MDAKVILFHGGCGACLETTRLFGRLMIAHPAFEIVDLRAAPHRIAEARAAGVRALPSLAKSDCVLPLEAHATLDKFEAAEFERIPETCSTDWPSA